jgi:HEAT repeat protein
MSKLSKMSVKELFALALKTPLYDENSDESWDAVHELRATRATRKIYKKARKLCHSKKMNKRQVGVTILSQFGKWEKRLFRKKRLKLLLKMIEEEDDPTMLHTLAISLGHFHDKRANPALFDLRDHDDAQVRYAVAFSLYDYELEYEEVAEALIELSTDSASMVRDWATFRLRYLEFDSGAIRDALYARLSDSDEETRGEALVGLAKRKDQRVFEPLLAELERMPDWSLPLEAAEELADVRLLPALRKLEENWEGKQFWMYDDLQKAIAACEGQHSEN